MNRRNFLLSASALAGASDTPDSILAKAVASGQLRAAVLRVETKGKVHERAFGAAKTDSPFLIASITKPMTAAGVMVLADRGQLRLEDHAAKYLPGLDGRITIRHLLSHTSGLPDMLPDNEDLRKRNAPLSGFVAGALQTPLLFDPGVKVSYQSMGILLASEIVQRITKKPFRDFLASEIFQPLGMARTALGMGRFRPGEVVPSQVEHADPKGGTLETKHWDWNSPYWRNLGAPWGGAHSTAADIAKFLRAFLAPAGKPLKVETARRMLTDQTGGKKPSYGVGWALHPKPFGHSGSTGTLCWADPEKDTVFVLLTSLPARVSNKLVIDPVSNAVRGGL
ncbi:MAG: beta-lactamase family protein [Acidobacteria bacterium]|nr:beta-lactamase family protein [Acidobacteriota bacterium]